jgi:hypothetical protein
VNLPTDLGDVLTSRTGGERQAAAEFLQSLTAAETKLNVTAAALTRLHSRTAPVQVQQLALQQARLAVEDLAASLSVIGVDSRAQDIVREAYRTGQQVTEGVAALQTVPVEGRYHASTEQIRTMLKEAAGATPSELAGERSKLLAAVQPLMDLENGEGVRDAATKSYEQVADVEMAVREFEGSNRTRLDGLRTLLSDMQTEIVGLETRPVYTAETGSLRGTIEAAQNSIVNARRRIQSPTLLDDVSQLMKLLENEVGGAAAIVKKVL